MNEVTDWNNLPLMLGVEEASQVLGYGKARIRKLCRSKVIPCIQCGRAYRIPKESLRNWLVAECSTPHRLGHESVIPFKY